jgi:hypothetical protein
MQRFNVRKADWNIFKTNVEKNVNRIEPTPTNYERFVKLLKTVAGKAMPRGHRGNYIPCWSKDYSILLSEYEENGCDVTVDRLMRLLDEERRVKWQSAMEKLDFTHSSRKSWDLLRKLGSTQPALSSTTVTTKEISNNLFKTSNIKPSKQEKN